MSNLLTRLRARRAETGDKGFTLVELLVVVVIIGILIAIAIPVYLNYTKSAKDKSAQSDLRNAISTIETCNANNNGYPATARSATAGADMTFAGTECAQKVKLSPATSIYYTPTNGGSTYVINSYNADGKKLTYCYDSNVGGSVKQSDAVASPAALAACP